MAQADAQTTRAAAGFETDFAADPRMRLYRLGRAVDGLRALAHDGPQETARDVVEITREDLAALFEIIGDQVAHASADLARGSH